MKSTNTKKLQEYTTIPFSILLGLGIWLLFAFRCLPFSPFDLTYVHILILSAPLFLIPLVWSSRLSGKSISNGIRLFALPTAILLAISFLLKPGPIAAMLTLPWLSLCVWLSIDQLIKYMIFAERGMVQLCHLMAFLYLPVGGAWAFADRLAFYPFDFPPTITLLTVAHFHFAGFLLPIMTGWAIQKSKPSSFLNLIAWGVILGIPLVAIGITTTHFHLPIVIEVIAVTVMASGGIGTGFLHLKLGWTHKTRLLGWLWILAGFALIGGMSLAFLYGWRHYFPISAITIPWMHALHGTLNAVGFALPGILGWYIVNRDPLEIN